MRYRFCCRASSRMFHVVISDGIDNLGQIVMHVSADGVRVRHPTDDAAAPGEPVPFVNTSRMLANRLYVRSPPRIRFEVLGRSTLATTIRRDGGDGSSIWIWNTDGAERAAPTLAT